VLLLVLASVVIGAGTALSPCALPVLPALLSVGATGDRRRPVGVVVGLSVTFLLTIIGGGELLRHLGLGDTTLRDVGIAVLLVAGVAVLVPALGAVIERPLVALSRLGPRSLGTGFGGGLIVGAALGFVYAPCAGPVLAAVVSVSAVTGRTVAVALAYVGGTAAVLLAIALGGRRVLEPLRRAGRGMVVQRVLGAVMIVTAIAFVADLDMRFETALARHTSSVTLTAGLESSHALQDKLTRLHNSKPRFAAPAPSSAPRAALPALGAAPDFTGTQKWFNTPGGQPLTLAGLRGRVVLVDFWTYTCINCLRTLPYLEAWDKRYRSEGLTIVGVHAPEFGFEREAGNVARAIRTNGIRYPVVQDNDLATWNAWGNQYWPAEYLIDARGQVRHVQFGEGDYDKSEAAIRALLAERGAAVGAARAQPEGITPVSAQTTPETYVGTARAQGWVGTAPRNGQHTYTAPSGALPLSRFQLGGTWRIDAAHATAVASATITAHVQARFVYLVLSPPPGRRSGEVDVHLDGGAPTVVHVTTQRLYQLVGRPTDGDHTVRLDVSPGTSAYAFTFG